LHDEERVKVSFLLSFQIKWSLLKHWLFFPFKFNNAIALVVINPFETPTPD